MTRIRCNDKIRRTRKEVAPVNTGIDANEIPESNTNLYFSRAFVCFAGESLYPFIGSRLEMRYMRYAVVIEKSDTGSGVFVPDLPGCVAVGETIQETGRLIKEAIQFHLEGMEEDGVEIPLPTAVAEYVEV